MMEITELADAILFTIKVVPGSSRTQVAGVMGDKLKIRIAAAPEKGKANECLISYLSKILNVRKNNIAIVSGMTSAVKTVRVKGLHADRVKQDIEAVMESDKKG